MTFTLLICIVAASAVLLWGVTIATRGNPSARGLLQASVILTALGVMIAGFIYGLHQQLP